MDREEARARAHRIGLEVGLLMGAYVVLAAGAVLSAQTGDGGKWFTGAGVVAILLALGVEYRNHTIRQQMNEIASTAFYGAKPERWRVPAKRRKVDFAAFFTVAIGTAWGFGGMLFGGG